MLFKKLKKEYSFSEKSFLRSLTLMNIKYLLKYDIVFLQDTIDLKVVLNMENLITYQSKH